jgi:hypothetical protein
VEISPDAPVVKEELFGPVLYVMKFQVAKKNLYLCVIDLPHVALFADQYLILLSVLVVNYAAGPEGSN